MTVLRAPFPWFGGKSGAADLVWSALGDVANYVEPFFGSGAVLLARPHAPRTETVNDRSAFLANFWRALKADPDGGNDNRLRERLWMSPHCEGGRQISLFGVGA